MDFSFKSQFRESGLIYKNKLEQIISKYSKLQDDQAIEVDLNTINTETLNRYLQLTKNKLKQLETESVSNESEESLQAHDVTSDSPLDVSHQNDGPTEYSVIASDLHVEDDVSSYVSQSMVSSLNETQRTLSELDVQPEDQDEELEMTLRSQGSSLVELYPSMISKISRVQHRQHVSAAAGSVLRRYRKWRCRSNRSGLNGTFDITMQQSDQNQKSAMSETTLNNTSLMETYISPFKRQIPVVIARGSPLHKVTSVQGRHPLPSPRRDTSSLRREKPVLVMDFSCLAASPKPTKIQPNPIFNASSSPSFSESFQSTVGPSQSCSPSAKSSADLSLRSKRLSLSSGCFVYERSGSQERLDTYGSPVRQRGSHMSPLKARVMARDCLRKSPYALHRSPRSDRVVSSSRELAGTRPLSSFLYSPQQNAAAPQRKPDDPPEYRPSPQTARHPIRRHLSFDSSMLPTRVYNSPKELDYDFKRLYHKFVCQSGPSPIKGPPCRLCSRSPQPSREHTSSTVVALALSPFALKKRRRELDQENDPQSKRSREGGWLYSPGSQRHRGREALRRRLCTSDLEPSRDSVFCSGSKHGRCEGTSSLQPSAEGSQVRSWHRPTTGHSDVWRFT